MEGRLIVPDINVKPVAFETERSLGHLKPLIRSYQNGGAERKEPKEANEEKENGGQ